MGKRCLFGLLCVSLVHVNGCASLPFGLEGDMWDLTVLPPDNCLYIFTEIDKIADVLNN